MELRHLRYFVAVAEELNFRRAAERLRVAQPALSSQIKDLEYELGVQLFDRDTGGVRLTDAGAAFLVESRLTLAQAQQAVAVAREAAKGRRGSLKVGYVAPLLMGFMPASLQAFHVQYPGVEVTLIELPIPEQLAELQTGGLHLGFAVAGYVPIPRTLEHRLVARSPIRAVMGRGHALAQASRISLADMAAEPLLSLSLKQGVIVHAELMRRNFTSRGLRHRPIRAVDGAETFRTMLESGLGLSLIPEIGSLSRSPDLLFKPLAETGDDLVLELHAVWRGGPNSELLQNFVAAIITGAAARPRAAAAKPGRRKPRRAS